MPTACGSLYRHSTVKVTVRIAGKYKDFQLFIDVLKTSNNGKLSKCCFPMRDGSDFFFPLRTHSLSSSRFSLYSTSAAGIHCGGSKITHIADMQPAPPSISMTLV